jgi:four helix bundle protein
VSEQERAQRGDELLVFVKWMDFVEWLFQATNKFPKSARFSFAQRIEGLALDVIEDLVEARYTRPKRAMLKRANLRLEKMRVLLRLAHKLRFLSHEGYEHSARQINEAGRMLGGWTKQQEEQ